MLDCECFQIAEWVCRVYWEKKGYKYLETAKNPAYFEKDIDFFVWMKDTGQKVAVEVKGSNYRRSFFVEYEVYNKASNTTKEGWFYKCRADWLFIVGLRDGFIYAFPLQSLRRFIDNKWLPTKTHEDRQQISTGKVVYIDDLITHGVKVNKINLEKLLQ